MSIDMAAVYEAWGHHVPGVTTGEVDALLPLVMAGFDRVPGLVAAYRAGRDTITPPARLDIQARHRREGGGKVALDLDGELFLSIADWSTDVELDAAYQRTVERARSVALATTPWDTSEAGDGS